MKAIIILSLCVAAALCENTYVLDSIEKKCLAEAGIAESAFLEKTKTLDISADDKKYKKYFLCDWKHRDVITADGNIDKKNLQKTVAQTIKMIFDVDESRANSFAQSAINGCTLEKKNNDEETVFSATLCLLKKIKESAE